LGDASVVVGKICGEWWTGEAAAALNAWEGEQKEGESVGARLSYPMHKAVYRMWEIVAGAGNDDEVLRETVETLKETERVERGESGDWEVVGTPLEVPSEGREWEGEPGEPSEGRPYPSRCLPPACQCGSCPQHSLRSCSFNTRADSLLRTLEILVDFGVEVNERDAHGNTPLSILGEVASKMLGKTAAGLAVIDVVQRCVGFLLKKGARMDLGGGLPALYPGMQGDVKISEREDIIQLLGGALAIQNQVDEWTASGPLPFRSLPGVKKMSDKEKATCGKAEANDCKICSSKFVSARPNTFTSGQERTASNNTFTHVHGHVALAHTPYHTAGHVEQPQALVRVLEGVVLRRVLDEALSRRERRGVAHLGRVVQQRLERGQVHGGAEGGYDEGEGGARDCVL